MQKKFVKTTVEVKFTDLDFGSEEGRVYFAIKEEWKAASIKWYRPIHNKGECSCWR